jgi:hypothetical protein
MVVVINHEKIGAVHPITSDEEDINTNKAATKGFEASVEEDYRNNRNGSQAIYFGTIPHRFPSRIA